MKIWHQSIAELEDIGGYATRLTQRIPSLVSPGTEVAIHGVRKGSYGGLPPAAVLQYPYAKYRIHDQVLAFVTQAEGEGYDAFVLATFAEPLLREARSLVDIPVTSMLESSLLVGCSLARKIALITLAPANAARLRDLVERHGLGSRLSGIYPLDPAVTEFDLSQAFTKPAAILEAFAGTAQRAIADGADCIIPAEGVLAELLAAQKIDRIEGAAVMDSFAVVFAYTEMMVTLRRRCGLGPGRRWDHPRPPGEVMQNLDAMFGPPGS